MTDLKETRPSRFRISRARVHSAISALSGAVFAAGALFVITG